MISGSAAFCRALQRIRVFQHADFGPETVGAGKDRMAFFFQANIVIFRHAVETGYEMAGIEQPFGNVKPMKPAVPVTR